MNYSQKYSQVASSLSVGLVTFSAVLALIQWVATLIAGNIRIFKIVTPKTRLLFYKMLHFRVRNKASDHFRNANSSSEILGITFRSPKLGSFNFQLNKLHSSTSVSLQKHSFQRP